VTATHINGRLDGLVDERLGVDSIRVQLRASSEGEPAADSASLNGWVKNLGHANVTPTVDLSLAASSFHALDKRSLADLYLSTTRGDFAAVSPLRLTGPLNAPVLRGNLRVDRGSIYLQDRDLARKQAVELFADTTSGVTAPAEPTRVSEFMSKLQIDNVNVALGEDVRLRSTEADVRLGGQLTLRTSSSPAARSAGSSAPALPGLALQGQLKTNGGTYNLNLGLVQREFQVLPNGVVTFDGPPENPILDIRAQYNVKQYQQRDLGVIVNLQGRVPNQVVKFTSNADYDISTSDLVSYLLTGKPGLDFGANSQASQVLASFLAPTLSAVAADQLRQSLGSWVDAFQLSFGAGNSNNGTVTKPEDYLTGATIGAEKQVTNNVFLSVNTSFCQLTNSQGSQGAYNPLAPFGAKVEYRFDPTFSLQLGREPDTNTRFCNSQQGFTGLYNTPQQFSLSLSRTWRF
jgi:translocation and assembly module TamB